MKYIAIASISISSKIIGARLLNLDTLEIKDATIPELENLQNWGCWFRNIRVNGGRLEWTQGEYSRYPSIDEQNGVTNENSITVIGIYNNGRYLISDFKGQTSTATRDKLVQYGKQYKLANSRVYEKGNKVHIASLSGEIEKIYEKVEMHYILSKRQIIVKLPHINITKLEIPNRIDNLELDNIESIIVKPLEGAKKITHLTLPDKTFELERDTLKQFTGLKVLECHSSNLWIRNGALSGCTEITDITLKGIAKRSYGTFENLTKLKHIKFDKKPISINMEMFSNCKSIDINDIMNEGLIGIESRAFASCTGIEKVDLPKSVKCVSIAAFTGCTNIREFRINSNNTRLKLSTNKNAKLLDDSPNALLYCPFSYPESVLRKAVASHVKIIRNNPTEREIIPENKYLKAAALGFGIRRNELATSFRELVGLLMIADDQEYKDSISECLRDYIMSPHSSDGRMFMSSQGASVEVYVAEFGNTENDNFRESKIGSNYAYILTNNYINAALVNRRLTLKRAFRLMQSGMEEKLRVRGKTPQTVSGGITLVDKEPEFGQFVFRLPTTVVGIDANNILRIYESEDNLTIDLKDGGKRVIYLG